MADTYKTLFQSNPSAVTLTDAYTATSQVVVSSIVVCNRSATPTKYRLSIAVGGATDNAKQYLAYDADVDGNDTEAITLGITLAVDDVIRVYAALATLSFTAFGSEIS